MTTQPRELHTEVTTVCTSRPRRCTRLTTEVCRSCGWHGPTEEDDGTGTGVDAQFDLFAPPTHTQDECDRRQTEPWFRYDQDEARMSAAGLPGVLAPPAVPRPDQGDRPEQHGP